jgi:hypothetical protein
MEKRDSNAAREVDFSFDDASDHLISVRSRR